ncbi:hypothetical protein [Actinomadura latina]|uniref:DUF8094 domain-containing protein n=1 Tax=Actinomadura latina TaxID=163603 RepID=A0A846Z794_9ACTN|nr:hypothetical protein [Actinomadura latina]NKZ06263.1 hypothetical protein [Actinomadura latina]
MRRAPLVAVAALLLAVAGCSGSVSGTGTEATEPSGKPAVTAEESLDVLKDWTERHNKAITSGEERQWRDTVTGALEAPVSARVRTYGKLPESAEISLSNPVFYVPRLDGFPKWFGIAGLERSGGRDQQVLGVFVKAKKADDWLAAHWLTFQGKPPQLDYDPQGYAVPAPDRGLPAAHAKYLADGDESAVVPDPYSRDARTKKIGDWTSEPGKFTPGPGPSYALRTQDGGSLVWYGLRQEQELSGGEASTLPAGIRDYLGKDDDKPGKTLDTSWQWLAIGYAPPSGKARVLGESVSLTSAR